MYSARKKYLFNRKLLKSVLKIQRRVRAFLCSNKLRLIRKQREEEEKNKKRKEELVIKRKAEIKRKIELAKRQEEHARQLMGTQTRKPPRISPSKEQQEFRSKSPITKRMERDNWALKQYENANFNGIKLKVSKAGVLETNTEMIKQEVQPSKGTETKQSALLIDRDNFQTSYHMFSKKHYM